MPGLDAAAVKDAARRAGFHACGIARAGPLDPGPLDRMLAGGLEADMAWLRTQRDARLDPARLLPGVRSVVVVALAYHAGDAPPAPAGAGAVARYARGRDYHAVMRRRLRTLAAEMEALAPGARTLATSDIAPVMEKAWAERAGVGWIGKNGCLITTRYGSWVVLGTVLVDRDLDPDAPHPDRCGSCAACLSACPTGAFPSPGVVDARRCISFWTIERRGEIPVEMAGRLGRWIFGCDDCQTVCPWNDAAHRACDPDLLPRPGQEALPVEEVLRLGEADYRARFNGTSLARARYDGLLRNALLLAGASGDVRRAELVRAHLGSPFPGVRAAAEWAIGRLEPGAPRGDGRRAAVEPPAAIGYASGVSTLAERLRAAREAWAVASLEAPAVLRATGKDAKDYLHRVTTQDLNALGPGGSAYAAVLNAKGRLLADLHVLVEADGILLVMDPRGAAEARPHLERFVIMDDVTFEDVSAGLRILPVLGPEAAARLEGRTAAARRIANRRRGVPAIDLLLGPGEAAALRAALVGEGAADLDEADLEALRISEGVARYGADMDASRLPMEAGLTRAAISFTKGCYTGQEVVLRATARGHLQRGLVQLALPPGGGPGTPLVAGGEEVGVVTSAADMPEGRLGLGYVRRAHWSEGERLATPAGEAVVRRVIVEDGVPCAP